jgi:hypothetical protein
MFRNYTVWTAFATLPNNPNISSLTALSILVWRSEAIESALECEKGQWHAALLKLPNNPILHTLRTSPARGFHGRVDFTPSTGNIDYRWGGFYQYAAGSLAVGRQLVHGSPQLFAA